MMSLELIPGSTGQLEGVQIITDLETPIALHNRNCLLTAYCLFHLKAMNRSTIPYSY